MFNQKVVSRYSPLSVTLHWLMAIVVIGALIAINITDFYPKGSPERFFIFATHTSLGFLTLILVVIRLIARVKGPKPNNELAGSRLQKIAATCVHHFLYLVMFAMPILGWLHFSVHGNAIPFFGTAIPTLPIGPSDTKSFIELHRLIGNILYYVLGLHALAALFHHYVFKDGTLKRMSYK